MLKEQNFLLKILAKVIEIEVSRRNIDKNIIYKTTILNK